MIYKDSTGLVHRVTVHTPVDGLSIPRGSDQHASGGTMGYLALLLACAWVISAAWFCGSGCANLPDVTDMFPTNAVSTTTTTTTSTTQPAPASAYRITRVTASEIFWTGPDLTWPEKDGCCGEAHLYRASGKGGKFDHVRRTSKQRDWKNIHGGYGGHVEPDNGERCTLVLVSYDGKRRVVIGEFAWVR